MFSPKTFYRWFWRTTAGAFALLFVAAVILVAWFALDPRGALECSVNRLIRTPHVTLRAARWKSSRELMVEGVRAGLILKAQRIGIRWSWRGLWRRHVEDLSLFGFELWVDESWFQPSGSKRSASAGRVWFLDHLLVGQGTQVSVQLAPRRPPLLMDLEGEGRDLPLGWGKFTTEELRQARSLDLRDFRLVSSTDPAFAILHIDGVQFGFRLAGLMNRELDALAFHHPTLDVDRNLFWFVDELRKMHAARPAPSSPTGPRWRARRFLIEGGKLDITRLHQIALKYPLEFEVSRENLDLEDLSLLSLQMELRIPNQDIRWDSRALVFKNLRGKIAFNLGGPAVNIPSAGPPKANDLVNTLYVDAITWRDLPLDHAWLSLVFDPAAISGHYGGAVAGGYLNGGFTCGWSATDRWNFWGTASKLDTRKLCEALASENVEMEGGADLNFTLDGQADDLTGALALKSRSSGTVVIRSLDALIDRIQQNTRGFRREALQAVVRGMRQYPYEHYALDVRYRRPNAELKFLAKGPVGQRKLELCWHGAETKN